MAADNHIMEALARIERKQDMVLEIVCKMAGISKLPQISEPSPCVVCSQPIEYQVAISEGVVLRKCGCKTGKIALDMGAFAPPALPTKKKDQEDEQRSDQEDRRDSNRGGGYPRR